MNGTTRDVDIEVGARYYIDGRPGELLSIAPTGYASFAYDGDSYGTNVQAAEVHEWKVCTKSLVEIQQAEAAAFFAEMFDRINKEKESE